MILDYLKSILIFKDLDDRSLRGIQHFVSAKVYRAGEYILDRNSGTNLVMALCSGLVRVTLVTPQGKEMVIRDVKVGEVFGDWSAIDGQQRSASVVAIKDSVVALISQEDFRTLVTHNPMIALRQMQELTRQLRGMTWRLTEFAALKASVRIQSVLLDFAMTTTDGLLIEKMVSHQEIAARAYTQREVVARELANLQHRGVIVKRGDGYFIPQPEELDIIKMKNKSEI